MYVALKGKGKFIEVGGTFGLRLLCFWWYVPISRLESFLVFLCAVIQNLLSLSSFYV